MNTPIILQIKKKEMVMSRRQYHHQYRSDWKTLHTIDYEQSKQLFNSIGGGPIVTEAQMAKLIAENFGDGDYMCIAIKKGRRGMWNFLMLKIENGWFVRTERTTRKIVHNLNKEKRKGPYPYLQSTQPVYKAHKFEEYRVKNSENINNNFEVKYNDSVW